MRLGTSAGGEVLKRRSGEPSYLWQNSLAGVDRLDHSLCPSSDVDGQTPPQ